jgi:uncharacterized caspase-like protein
MNKALLAIVAISGLLLGALSATPASAERRVALVIGNSAYRSVPSLPNTTNDASAMTSLFTKAGFDVVESHTNLGVLEFKRSVRDFLNTARDADIAVVYYAGHGIEIQGTNFLIPVDAKLASDYDADDEAVSLDRVIWALQPVRMLRLIILDACRDNPFIGKMQRTVAVRAVSSGLATIDPTNSNTLIAYAAKAGSTSADGGGKNSPFTAALVKYLTEPGLDIRIALGRVRDEVLKSTGNMQEPFVYGSLGGQAISLVPAPQERNATPAVANPNEVQRDYEFAERVGTRAVWESFLAAHKTGFYAELARAQIARLAATPAPSVTRVAPAKPAEPGKRDDARPVERPRTDPAPQVASREPPKPPASANPTAAQPESDCARDRERLARLRADPQKDEVVRFVRELACEQLRAQVVRLHESVVGDAPPESTPGGTDVRMPVREQKAPPEIQVRVPSQAGPRDPGRDAPPTVDTGASRQAQSCQRDHERLARLRSNPARDEVLRFERELACEQLRPQVLRLRESVAAD